MPGESSVATSVATSRQPVVKALHRLPHGVQLGQLDAATGAIRPILDLPPERQISWIRKRLARLPGVLRSEPDAGSVQATDLYDEIQALAA